MGYGDDPTTEIIRCDKSRLKLYPTFATLYGGNSSYQPLDHMFDGRGNKTSEPSSISISLAGTDDDVGAIAM